MPVGQPEDRQAHADERGSSRRGRRNPHRIGQVDGDGDQADTGHEGVRGPAGQHTGSKDGQTEAEAGHDHDHTVHEEPRAQPLGEGDPVGGVLDVPTSTRS